MAELSGRHASCFRYMYIAMLHFIRMKYFTDPTATLIYTFRIYFHRIINYIYPEHYDCMNIMIIFTLLNIVIV